MTFKYVFPSPYFLSFFFKDNLLEGGGKIDSFNLMKCNQMGIGMHSMVSI